MNSTPVAIVAFSGVFAYLYCFFRFAAALEKKFPEDWARLGHPEKYGVIGQFKYLGVVLGLLPISVEASDAFHKDLIRIRVLLLVSIVGLVAFDLLTA